MYLKVHYHTVSGPMKIVLGFYTQIVNECDVCVTNLKYMWNSGISTQIVLKRSLLKIIMFLYHTLFEHVFIVMPSIKCLYSMFGAQIVMLYAFKSPVQKLS